MRAAVARHGKIVTDDVAEPVPGPGDALVAVRSCGICGSDLHTRPQGSTVWPAPSPRFAILSST